REPQADRPHWSIGRQPLITAAGMSESLFPAVLIRPALWMIPPKREDLRQLANRPEQDRELPLSIGSGLPPFSLHRLALGCPDQHGLLAILRIMHRNRLRIMDTNIIRHLKHLETEYSENYAEHLDCIRFACLRLHRVR